MAFSTKSGATLSERMRITSSGKVGVGTTNVTSLLTVAGTAEMTDLKVGSNGLVIKQDTTNTNQLQFSSHIMTPASVYAGFGTNASSNSQVLIKGPTADSTKSALDVQNSAGTDLFYVRDDGNVGIGTTTPTLGPLQMGSGAYVTVGGVWTNASDRNIKENFTQLNRQDVLKKILQLPVTEWNYKKENSMIRHIGPMAQDFYAIFGLGNSDKSISSIDPSGVALVGVQALAKQIEANVRMYKTMQGEIEEIKLMVADNAREIASVKAENAAKDKEIAKLKMRLDRIEKMLLKK
jgi:hypothetical protein